MCIIYNKSYQIDANEFSHSFLRKDFGKENNQKSLYSKIVVTDSRCEWLAASNISKEIIQLDVQSWKKISEDA